MIMKRHTFSSPQAQNYPNENGNYGTPRNDSEYDARLKNTTKPPVITSQISRSTKVSLPNNEQTTKEESKAIPATSKSPVQSSKANFSEVNGSSFSTTIKRAPEPSHKHHHHNHSHQLHHDHKPVEKVHAQDNHHPHDHKQEETHGHDNQHHHHHPHPHHHNHHHHHHGQNDHHKEKISHYNFTVLESLRSTKNPKEASKTKSLTMIPVVSANPMMTKLVNITSKTPVRQTSRSISPMITFITRKRDSNVQGKSTTVQQATTILHRSITTRPTIKSLNTQPVTLPTTKNEITEKSSATPSSTLKLTGKNVTLSMGKSMLDKILILSTLKPIDKIVTTLTSRSIDKVDILSTLKPTDNINILSTSKSVDRDTKLSTLKPTQKVNISSTNQVNIASSIKSTNKFDSTSIQKQSDKGNNSSTLNPEEVVYIPSTLMPINKTVTQLNMKSTDEISRLVSGTIQLPTLQRSNTTERLGKKEDDMTRTTKSSDVYTSNSTMKNNTTSSTAFKKEVTKIYTVNITQSTNQTDTKKQTEATDGIFKSPRPLTKKPVGKNETLVFKTKINSTSVTSFPLTKYSLTIQNISAIAKNSLNSSLDIQTKNNSKSVITENNTLYSSSQAVSFPFSVEYTTNATLIQDENTTLTTSSYNKTNLTNSSTFFMNESSQFTQKLGNTENYMSDPNQNNISNSSINQPILDDSKLTNNTDILVSQSNATNVESTSLNATTQSSSASKRSRGSRSRRTYTSSALSSTYTDDWQSDTIMQDDLNLNNLDNGQSYTSVTNTYNWVSTTNYQDWDSTTQGLSYDETSTSTNSNYNGGYSTQSSYSYGNNDVYNYGDDTTTPQGTNYDDNDGIQSSFGYNYGNKNVDDDYDTNTQSIFKSYAPDSDYDEIYSTSTQSLYATDYNDEYDPSTKSTYRGYNSDYNNGYDQSTQGTYSTYTPYYDENYDLSTQSTYSQYTSDYDNSYDLSMQSSNGYDDFKTKDTFDSGDNNDYDMNSKTMYDTSSYSSQMNQWQDNFKYTSSLSLTQDEFDSDEITDTTKSEFTKSSTQNLGTVSVTTKSPYYTNTGYFNMTKKKRSKKRWYGYTDTIALNTTTTPYTGPSTMRQETIIHETVTRFMPGGVKYRYSKIHWDDSNCELFNPWSPPPDLSTIFDYYKFRKVYYSKSKTFWEDIKHYFVKFVRIFKKDFRKGKTDG